MSNDEKMCPLTKMTCYGKECAWWYFGDCAVATLAAKTEEYTNEMYFVRKELESK